MTSYKDLSQEDRTRYLDQTSIDKLNRYESGLSKSAKEELGKTALKNGRLALFLSLTLGLVGGDRFYLGQTTRGLAKLMLTLSLLLSFWTGIGLIFALVFIWQICDIFLIQAAAREVNGQIIQLKLAYLARLDARKGGANEGL